jgi:hypothetical protein
MTLQTAIDGLQTLSLLAIGITVLVMVMSDRKAR